MYDSYQSFYYSVRSQRPCRIFSMGCKYVP
jgi:hypothetical protein